MMNLLEKFIPFQLGVLGYVFVVLHISILSFVYSDYENFFHEEWSLFKLLFSFVYSCLSLFTLYHLVNLWTQNRPFLKSFLSVLLLFLLIATGTYMIQSNGFLDFFILIDEIDTFTIGDTTAVFNTLFDHIHPLLLILLFLLLFLLFYLDFRFGILSGHKYSAPLAHKRGFISIMYLILLLNPLPYKDGISSFFYSVIDYYLPKNYFEYKKPSKKAPYPYVQSEFPYTKEKLVHSTKRPHVFIILKESLNQNVIEAKTPDGREYTPYYNKLIREGLYIEKYYGNATRTCNGTFSVLTSLVPPIVGKVTTLYPKLNFLSLPSIFQKNGYDTIYFQAYENISFDMMDKSLLNEGFLEKQTVTPYLKEIDKPHVWGWGLEDGPYFERFFDYLDQYREKKSRRDSVLYFVVLSTISSHYPYEVPKPYRYLYKEPKNFREKYANAIYLSDVQLEVFFKNLKKRKYLDNSLVIVTSDHGFPVGGHRFENNELGFYDESFRIPFVLIWKGKIIPKRIKEGVFSHIDITPSLVDLLKLSVKKNHFQGTSIFNPKHKNIHYLVQPHNGRYISVIDHPFKYIKHLRTGNQYIFNLEEDPRENHNLIENYSSEEMKAWDKKLEYLFINQALIQSNQIWEDVPNYSSKVNQIK